MNEVKLTPLKLHRFLREEQVANLQKHLADGRLSDFRALLESGENDVVDLFSPNLVAHLATLREKARRGEKLDMGGKRKFELGKKRGGGGSQGQRRPHQREGLITDTNTADSFQHPATPSVETVQQQWALVDV